MGRALVALAVALAGCDPPAGTGAEPDLEPAPCTDGGACDGAEIDLGDGDLWRPAPRATGEPCAVDRDCGGSAPQCTTKDFRGVTWPEGYCTSLCDPSRNQEGYNPDCPGGLATCEGGTCLRACFGAAGCQRDGYACFFAGAYGACEPAAMSGCDPTKCDVCPQQTCGRAGFDDVGQCRAGCDPFAQACPDENGVRQACYATPDCGRGACYRVGTFSSDGDPCQGINGCAPGFACRVEGLKQLCRPYCGGPGAVGCGMGFVCGALFAGVQVATVGVCTP